VKSRKTRLAETAAAMALLAPGLACAGEANLQTVEVARAKVTLPGGNWTVLSRSKVTAVRFESGGSIDADVVSLALVEHNRIEVLLVIKATAGGAGGKIEWSSGCDATTPGLWAARPTGGNPDDLECAYASGLVPTSALLSDRTTLGVDLTRSGLALPGMAVRMSAAMGSRMGALMEVDVWAPPSMSGPEPAPANVPARVNPRHAAYALQLARSVRDCLYSWRGRMTLPPITLSRGTELSDASP
jgi:hypothetical protein